MLDVTQWMIDLMIDDLGRLVAGIIILASVLELLLRVKGWFKWWT